MKLFIWVIIALSSCIVRKSKAQSVMSLPTSAAIQENLELLAQNKRLLYMGMAPGEENSLLLTTMRKKYHFQTAYFMLTRGERQKNYSGSEKGVDLGIIHGAEMQAAGRIGHFDLFASSYKDVGTRDSSILFTIWNRRHVLSDLVAVIRSYRPDIIVIAKADPGDSSTAWFQNLCIEANQLAADEHYPIASKQAITKDKHRSINSSPNAQQSFGAYWVLTETTPDNQQQPNAVSDIDPGNTMKINLTGYDSILGKTYRTIALQSKQEERSIFADLSNIPLGQDSLYLRLLAGQDTPDLKDSKGYGVWSRFANGKTIQGQVALLLAEYREHPQFRTSLVPDLKELFEVVNKTAMADADRQIITSRLTALLVSCAGLEITAYPDRDLGVLGQDFNLQVDIRNPVTPLTVHRITLNDLLDTALSATDGDIQKGENLFYSQKIHLPLFQAAYQPFWLNKSPNVDGSYQIDSLMQGRLTDTPCYTVHLSTQLDSLPLNISIPVIYKQFDRFKGTQFIPFYTVEPVLLMQSPDVLLTQIAGETKPFKHPEITLRMKTLFQDSSLLAIVKIRQMGLKGEIDGQMVQTGATQEVYKDATYLSPAYNQNMHITLPYDEVLSRKWHPETPILKPQVLLRFPEGAQAFSSNIKMVGYPYQKSTIYNFHSQTIIIGDTIRTKGSRIAYIGGAPEDSWENAIHQLGYRLTELSPNALLKINQQDNLISSAQPDTGRTIQLSDSIKQFDAIVWNDLPSNEPPVPETLRSLHMLLSEYVRQGGRVLNLSPHEEWNQAIPGNDSIIRSVILNDTNTVRLTVQDQDTLLNFPNRIAAVHFSNWYGVIANGTIYSKTRTEKLPIKLEGFMSSANYFPVSWQKSGKGAIVNCFLDLPGQFSNGSPFAFKFLANLLANLPENPPEKKLETKH